MAVAPPLPQTQVPAVLSVLPGRAAFGAVYHREMIVNDIRANYEDAGKLF